MKYVVLICARNEEKYIASCLSSIYFQTYPPEMVVVVDDGSTDETAIRAKEFEERMPIMVLQKPDRGFSAVGTILMADTYNVGLDYLSSLEWDFILILGADTSIPPNYVEELNNVMTIDLGAISGRHDIVKEDYASATGRFIRREIIDKLGGRLPRTYAWESSVIHCGQYIGLERRSFPIAIYNLRPGGQGKRSNVGLGRGVKELGYYWVNVIHKALLNLKNGKPIRAIEIIYGYLIHRPEKPLPDWAKYTNESQKKAFRRKLRSIFQWF